MRLKVSPMELSSEAVRAVRLLAPSLLRLPLIFWTPFRFRESVALSLISTSPSRVLQLLYLSASPWLSILMVLPSPQSAVSPS